MLRTVTLSPAQRVLANVATAAVKRISMSKSIAAAGVVDYAEPLQSIITSRFRGRIEKLHVNVTGAAVKRGDMLCDIYSPDLITAQQEYVNLARQAGESNADNGIREQLRQTARRRLTMHYGMSEKQVDALQASGVTEQTVRVYARSAGTVVQKNVMEGQYVDEGGVLFQLADLSRVWVYVEVPEAMQRFVRMGMSVQLRSDAWPENSFTGRVTFIDPAIKADTRTLRVRVEAANPGGRLRPGMFVNASLEAYVGGVLAVPEESVLNTGRRSVVWVEARKNQFEPRTVSTGASSGGMIEIVSGLQDGETVVMSGGFLIDSESRLQNPGAYSSADGRQSDGAAQDVAQPGAGEEKVRTIRIKVDMGYEPDVVRVRKGEKVKLLFDRREDSECSAEVVFKDFNIRRFLPAFKTTPVIIQPMKAGTFAFSCGMDMLHGKLVVEDKP
jgi:Cu(I)/Ag(I) efflux system membrane fusion protein